MLATDDGRFVRSKRTEVVGSGGGLPAAPATDYWCEVDARAVTYVRHGTPGAVRSAQTAASASSVEASFSPVMVPTSVRSPDRVAILRRARPAR